MVKTLQVTKKAFAVMAILCVLAAIAAPFAFGAGAEGGAAGPATEGLAAAGMAIGAGIAFAAGALGTGIVQYAVCASGIGVLAEKREMLPLVIIFIAIPETLVILGFVLAIMLIGKIV
jgi:V/A-type H+-transporting ATPase subunit K